MTKAVPRAKTAWDSDILCAFEGLRGCGSYIRDFLQGHPICYSDAHTADLRLRMGKVWRYIDMRSDNQFVTYHSWFDCPILDLQADSCTCVRNGGAPLMPPLIYIYSDISEP